MLKQHGSRSSQRQIWKQRSRETQASISPRGEETPEYSTIVCRMNTTASPFVLVRWHRNVQTIPPTTIGHITIPLSHTGYKTRLSPMDLQDIQRALKQQTNIRLTNPHAVGITSGQRQHHQRRRARRATGKPINFVPCNSTSSEAVPAGRQRTLLPVSTRLASRYLIAFLPSTAPTSPIASLI
jgi:hypothetical protein